MLLEKTVEIGYKDFARANQEIDRAFIEVVQSWISARGTPLLLTIVGPTASGKSEICARLLNSLEGAGFSCTSVEMDNFYKDRVFRDGRPMDAAVIHYPLFIDSINALLSGKAAEVPRYDFIQATSSHDLMGSCVRVRQPRPSSQLTSSSWKATSPSTFPKLPA